MKLYSKLLSLTVNFDFGSERLATALEGTEEVFP